MIKIIGLVMIFISAGLYLTYPSQGMTETLWLSGACGFALFGGAFAIHGKALEKEKKKDS